MEPASAEILINEAFTLMKEFDQKYSPDQDNVMRQVNNLQSGEIMVIPKELQSMIEAARQINTMSDGLYDITIGPLTQVYGFKTTNPSLPSPDDWLNAKKRTGFTQLSLNTQNQEFYFKKAGMSLDVGGLAKGYILDQVYQLFKSRGVHSALINGGGDIRVIGQKAGRPFKIGIVHPRKRGSLLGSITLQDGEAIATSGDYERFFMAGGKRYCHIFNPLTGRPGNLNQAATVIADSSLKAETLSLTSFLLTAEIALEFLQKNKYNGLIVDSTGQIHHNQEFQGRVQLNTTNQRQDYLFFLMVIVLFIISLLLSNRLRGNQADIALVSITNQSDQKIPLTVNQKHHVNSVLGEMTILVENGTIQILDAPCPDQLCVKQGKINRQGETIVCVPGETIIKLEGNTEELPDAITR
jgi:thiamine biosynthesis lipoprotein